MELSICQTVWLRLASSELIILIINNLQRKSLEIRFKLWQFGQEWTAKKLLGKVQHLILSKYDGWGILFPEYHIQYLKESHL